MHDFNCCSAADMHYDIMKDRVGYLKESREGKAFMCKIMEEIRTEGRTEGEAAGKMKTIFSLFKSGEILKETAAKYLGITAQQLDEKIMEYYKSGMQV